jgi:hypothetical protein
MRAIIAVALIVSSFFGAAQPVELPRDPDSLAKLIEAAGPRAVLERAWYPSSFWAKVIVPGIEAGSPKWLKVAALLRPGTDAGATSELRDALYEALPRNPYRVLPILMSEGGSAEEVCRNAGEFVDPPKGGIAKYLARLERSLYEPKSPKLKSMRAECLNGIKSKRAQGMKVDG